MSCFQRFFIVCVFLSVAFSSQLEASGNIGVVRYMEVLASHPRMRNFDFQTRRFTDGLSAVIPVKELEKRGLLLDLKYKTLKAKEQQILSDYQNRLADPRQDKSLAEKRYWGEKRKNDKELEDLGMLVFKNASDGEFGGLTIDVTLLPEIKNVYLDVENAIKEVALRRGCKIVHNETLPLKYIKEDFEYIPDSYGIYLKNASRGDVTALKEYFSNTDKIISAISEYDNLLKPVIFNSLDLTAEVIKELGRTRRIRERKGVRK